MGWEPGEQILWCYPTEARPVTVVADDDDGLAVWLAPATQILRLGRPDGSAFRDRPVEERFHGPHDWSLAPWFGEGILMVAPPGAAYSLWLFRRDGGAFWGWYGNLEEAHVRSTVGVHSRDHVLDVWMDEAGAVHWKDEDELEEVVRMGRFSADEATAIRAEGERLHAAMSRRRPPFDGAWLDWRPDPAWPMPVLPASLTAMQGKRRGRETIRELLAV
jgi:hypothetical protein